MEKAQKHSVGKEKWYSEKPNYKGIEVPLKQTINHAPVDKPVWFFENGDMYSGQWKEKGPKGHAVEHGFGISSNNYPDKYKGMVYIGEWKNGTLDGEGESF